MDAEDIQKCSSCGMCCSGERYGLILLEGDYERWRWTGRDDILQYVETSIRGIHRAIIWKNVETGDYLDRCPFLVDVGEQGRLCTIQDTKPKICREFWCAWCYGLGEKGEAFRTLNGWTERARQSGFG